MYNILPRYLLDIANNIIKKKYSAIFNLKCTCDNEYFVLYRNKETDEEIIKRKKWETLLNKYNGGGYSDELGNVYLIKKNLFGVKSAEIKINKSEIPNPLTVVKAKCSKCGKEYIIFDNSKNGYDAVVDNLETKNSNKKNVQCQYKAINNKCKIIKVRIANDLLYEDFAKEFPGVTTESFANAFSEISIYLLENKRYRCIFNEETR